MSNTKKTTLSDKDSEGIDILIDQVWRENWLTKAKGLLADALAQQDKSGGDHWGDRVEMARKEVERIDSEVSKSRWEGMERIRELGCNFSILLQNVKTMQKALDNNLIDSVRLANV